MQPWIRKHNYSQDFFYTAYKLYAETHPSYPVDYYKINKDMSIMDDEYHEERGTPKMDSASYEKHNVGELSGVKFDKILSFPVHGLDAVQPSSESGERGGLSAYDSMVSKIDIPQIYNFTPIEGDAVDINFGLKQDGKNNDFMWVISKIDYAHFGDYLNIFRCTIVPAHFLTYDIEKQLNNIYMFFEPEKNVLPVSNATFLYKIISKMETNSRIMSDNFNKKINMIINM